MSTYLASAIAALTAAQAATKTAGKPINMKNGLLTVRFLLRNEIKIEYTLFLGKGKERKNLHRAGPTGNKVPSAQWSRTSNRSLIQSNCIALDASNTQHLQEVSILSTDIYYPQGTEEREKRKRVICCNVSHFQ